MLIYFLGLFISVFCVLLLKPGKVEDLLIFKKGKLHINRYFLCLFLSMLPLTIISAIRYDVGTDYFNTYVKGFEIIKNGESVRDIGFGTISKFVLLFTDDYIGLFVVTSIFMGFFVYLSIFEQSDSIVLSIILYMITCEYFISMNMVRQSMATALFLYSLKYLHKKCYMKYIILIIIAATIHTSAILYLVLIFYELVYKFRKQVLAVSFLFFVFSKEIVDVIKFITFRVPFLRNYFYWYFNSIYDNSSFNKFSFLVQLVVLIFIIIVYEKNPDERINLYLSMQIIATVFLLLSKALPLAQRMSYLFSFANIIYIPNCIKMIGKKKSEWVISISVVFFFFVYMWITIIIRGYNEVVPYKSIFSR